VAAPELAAVLATVVAVAAGLAAGTWIGAAGAATGSVLFAVLVADHPTENLLVLPIWIGAVAAGLLADVLERSHRERRVAASESAALRGDAEAKYRALAEALPLVTWLYSPGDRAAPVYVSPQVETLLGYSPSEWTSQPDLFTKLLHPDDRDRVRATTGENGREGKPSSDEYRLVARDGRIVWVREETTTVKDSGGDPVYTQTLLIDAGERKRASLERERLARAEDAARSEAAERQRRIDLLRDVGRVLGSSTDRVAAAQRVAQVIVRDLADWCVLDVADEGPLTQLAVARAEQLRADGGPKPSGAPDPDAFSVLESGRPQIVPGLGEPVDSSDGARFGGGAAQSLIRVPLRAQGRPIGVLTLARTQPGPRYGADELALAEDLAARIAVAIDRGRLLVEVEARADADRVLTYVADGILLLDRGGIVRSWNPAAEAITGIGADDVVGRAAADAIRGWQEAAASIPVATSPDPGHPEIVIPLETERGERWISISGVQFFGGTVYAFRDLTEARELDELKADFIATASHELRTPLAAVYGAAQTLLRHDFALDEAGRDRFVSLIADESDRLGRIVNEILLANQLDAGRFELGVEPFDPVELAERVVEATRAYAPPEISLELSVPGYVPTVAADRDKVRQVLVNLVENAIKYSPQGGRVEVALEDREATVLFSVKDEGLGIPDDERERIFQKFYRVDAEMRRGVGGTGLGLYICHELVSRMGGHIWVESSAGEGSTFLFELPTAESTSRTRSLGAAADRHEDDVVAQSIRTTNQ
jgi:PAS domain S-box-containing protein